MVLEVEDLSKMVPEVEDLWVRMVLVVVDPYSLDPGEAEMLNTVPGVVDQLNLALEEAVMRRLALEAEDLFQRVQGVVDLFCLKLCMVQEGAGHLRRTAHEVEDLWITAYTTALGEEEILITCTVPAEVERWNT